MGAVIRTVTNLKDSVEAIEKKVSGEENREIKEILEAQKVINEVIDTNADAIRRIDQELKKSKFESKSGTKNTPKEGNDYTTEVVNLNMGKRKCRYFNKGYCKYNQKCRFVHPSGICTDYIENKKCEKEECSSRHPKQCKWDLKSRGCKRGIECAYLHTATESPKCQNSERSEFKCAGCKDVWNERKCVQEHYIENMAVFFCLNCNDWIRDKAAVFNEEWTMFDDAGFLQTDI